MAEEDFVPENFTAVPLLGYDQLSAMREALDKMPEDDLYEKHDKIVSTGHFEKEFLRST